MSAIEDSRMRESIRKAAIEIQDQVAIMLATLPAATVHDAVCRFVAIEQYARMMLDDLELLEPREDGATLR
jgi:hypothetical protein